MKKTSRRTFGKQLTGTIAALQLTPLFAGAQKRKPGDEKDKDFEDSPIMVGGGGGGALVKDRTRYKNRCRFKKGDAYYKDPDPTGPDKKKPFTAKDKGWRISTFKITTLAKTEDFSNLLPRDECKIEVSCKGSRDDVTIFSNATEMGIEMDTRQYKDKGDHEDHENADDASYVNKVELFGRNGRIRKWEFDDDDRAKVCVDWKRDSTMTCAL